MNRLNLSDLVLFGTSSILGSGGFNLIGNAIASGKDYFPFALAAVGLIFAGSAYSYTYAHDKYKKNNSEALIVEAAFGTPGKLVSHFSILGYNIISIAVVLVLCAKLLIPDNSWFNQILFASTILLLMIFGAFQQLDINKSVINIFSLGIIAILSVITFLGCTHITKTVSLGTERTNLYDSLTYFFFILAGHDTLMKFSEEAADTKDINKSFYISIALSFTLIAGTCIAAMVYIKDFSKINVNDIVSHIFKEAFNDNIATIVKYVAIILMTSTSFVNFLATIRYYNSITDTTTNSGIFVIGLLSLGIICINHLSTLVKFADVGLILTLLCVALAVCVERYKTGEVPYIDGLSGLGLLTILGLITAKHSG